MLVVDTSAVLEVLVGRSPNRELGARIGGDGDLHAPHLIDIELLHALRGLIRGGQLSADRAADARHDFADLTLVRYGHAPLADRIWELRENLTAYDAAFVSLAELLDVPLLTCDAKLEKTAVRYARVELFGAD